MDISLNNKNAVVCGSTQGIGLATAIEFAQNGANLTLIARNESKLVEALKLLPNNGSQTHRYITADFSEPDKLEFALETLTKEISILVNNTGGPAGGKLEKAETDELYNAFRNHVICNQILVKKMLPSMKELRYGRIINIISTSVKAPIAGLGVSNTIRGAVANWAKTLASEVGKYGITVNNVLPGFTDTNRLSSLIEKKANKENKNITELEKEMKAGIPARRFGEASEVANAISFLASPAAAYISGINLPVDGGRLPCL